MIINEQFDNQSLHNHLKLSDESTKPEAEPRFQFTLKMLLLYMVPIALLATFWEATCIALMIFVTLFIVMSVPLVPLYLFLWYRFIKSRNWRFLYKAFWFSIVAVSLIIFDTFLLLLMMGIYKFD